LLKVMGSGRIPEAVLSLCRRFRHIFSRTVQSKPSKIPKFKLSVAKDSDWHDAASKGGARLQPHDRNCEINRQLDLMLSLGVIEQAQYIGYFSQVLLKPKPNGKWRFCIDYRKLNTVSLLDAGHPLPNISEMLQRLGSRKVIWAAKMAYHQGGATIRGNGFN
jgi:hypothetical protein